MSCYICDEEASVICSTCESFTCDKHYKIIHRECKIGRKEKTARLDINY